MNPAAATPNRDGPAPPGGRALRILHVNSMLTGGGTDDQCVHLAHGLHRLGQAVWLAGPEGPEISKVARQLQVPFLITPPEGPLKLRFILGVARFIRRERIQLVHGHHGRDLWPTILAARWSGQRPRIVLTRHLAKSPSSWVSRRFLLGQCDALIAVSQFVAKVLREGVDDPASPESERHSRPPLIGDYRKIRVIYGGIDAERFRPMDGSAQRERWGLAPEHYAFGVVGGYALPRGKGQREFLRAAARIHQEAPGARFLVIGRGNMADLLCGDIERLGLTGKAWLTPYCQDMPAAMNALDCLVHPQIGTEAFPGVVLEATACGKPVIASDLDGIPEGFAVGRYGRLVPPEDIEALSKAMLAQLHEPALSLGEREALRQRVASGYSLPLVASRVLELYQRVLGGQTADLPTS